jgi:GrpB-like predicted nucleotidyltransferase (UPF0157 family)
VADARSPRWDAELIGGPEHREIVLVRYDPQWPATFEQHRARIVGTMADRAERVEHVGSTSVPGLLAKPIIDIQVSVARAEDESAYVPALEDAGYTLRVREPGHRMLRTQALDVHVHVCAVGSDWERRHLLFRDWLRRSDADRALYARMKTQLAKRSWPTMNDYADAKTRVIAEITKRAEEWSRTAP